MAKIGPKMAKNSPGYKSPQNGQFFTFCFLYLFSPIALNETLGGSKKPFLAIWAIFWANLLKESQSDDLKITLFGIGTPKL